MTISVRRYTKGKQPRGSARNDEGPGWWKRRKKDAVQRERRAGVGAAWDRVEDFGNTKTRNVCDIETGRVHAEDATWKERDDDDDDGGYKEKKTKLDILLYHYGLLVVCLLLSSFRRVTDMCVCMSILVAGCGCVPI